MRDLKKQIHHCNIIPSYLPKWVFLEKTKTVFDEMEMVFGEMKTVSKWKRNSGCNGTAPIGHKCIENPKTRNPFKLSTTLVLDLDQNRKRLFINALIPCLCTQGTPKTLKT